MANDFKVLEGVPKNIGRGEGGGKLPKLYDVLKQIDDKLNEQEERLNILEENGQGGL